MKTFAVFFSAGVVLLAGCAGRTMWIKDGATASDFERDKNQCIYEAEAATASYSSGPTARTQSGAIAQGFGEGMTRGMRQNDLAVLCMRAKGWAQVPVASAASAGPIAPEPMYIYRTPGVDYGAEAPKPGVSP